MITCTQKRGVVSIFKNKTDTSSTFFFAVAQIIFLASNLALKYLSIIQSIFISLMKDKKYCNLENPISLEAINSVITLSNTLSIRSFIQILSIEELYKHRYCSLLSLPYGLMLFDKFYPLYLFLYKQGNLRHCYFYKIFIFTFLKNCLTLLNTYLPFFYDLIG